MFRNDLLQVVSDNEKINALAKCSYSQLLLEYGGVFARMKDYDQKNPHHHLDLLKHSIKTACNIGSNGMEDQDFIELRIAALLHDIGKLNTARIKEDRTVYYGHPAESRKIAEKTTRL